MTHRRADVYLDPKQPRCEPAATGCHRKMTCARYLARIDGAPLQDYSRQPNLPWVYVVFQCVSHQPIERPPASTGEAPRVHKSVRGLS